MTPAPIARRPGWRRALAAWLAACARRPFAPGTHDCALFAAGAIEAMTGHDPAARFRGRYATLRGGLRVLRHEGIASPEELAGLILPPVAPAQAQPGDIALVEGPGGATAFGVVQGAGGVYVLHPEGLAVVSAGAIRAAWAVGAR